MRTMDQSEHIVANVLMTIRSDTTDADAYSFGYHGVTIDGDKRDVIGSGRYIDQFEKRGEEWRVAERLVVIDWFAPIRTRPNGASGCSASGSISAGGAQKTSATSV